jgi:hypothetical protein
VSVVKFSWCREAMVIASLCPWVVIFFAVIEQSSDCLVEVDRLGEGSTKMLS